MASPAQTGPGRHIVILALRRSGTTALWRLLRQDPQHRCYDEPLSPHLGRLPANNSKATWDEFIALRARDPEAWAARFAPVGRGAELSATLSPAQAAYLRDLAAEGPIVIDETRAPAKLAGLHAALGASVCVHLYRHPIAFASSHLIASQNKKILRQRLYRTGIFWRRSHFDGWGMEAFWRAPLRGTTERFLDGEGVRAPPARAPGFHKLLALWLASFRRLERDGPRLCGTQFVSLSFEAFCAAPQPHLARLYRRAGRRPFAADTSGLHAASPGYRPDDPRWPAAARAVGFTEAELARFFPHPGVGP